MNLKLLPHPRFVKRLPGAFTIPANAVLHLDPALPHDTVLLPIAERLQSAAKDAGVELEPITGPTKHPRLAIRAFASPNAPKEHAGYTLEISSRGISLGYRNVEGLRSGVATLRQLLREHGRRLPCVSIRDWADFQHRGLMLDVSRGRVPKLETLMQLASHLADFKINELQLYIEHTFAYRDYEPVWRDWSALTAEDILRLDAHCRRLGIELVPNQNSFGHLRYWLAYPPLKKLAETSKPWLVEGGAFLRHPTTLAPNHPGTIPFLRALYDELLPHFSSNRINVGCDETWDLGRGQSREICDKLGKGRVYLDFLKKIHREISARGKQMQFWGDIILNCPELVAELPKDCVALNWGYERAHPFDREAGIFEKSNVPFYVCPGTSAWMSLVGRHDIAFANLQIAARMGVKHGAIGYLNTDWGDGGHPQPLAVSYLPYLYGASASWCGESFDEKLLAPVISRDIFEDPSGNAGKAALGLGLAHLKLDYLEKNTSPLGAVIAAPEPKLLEIFCRNGLKYYARISARNIRAAMEEVEAQRDILRRSAGVSESATVLHTELDLAARMSVESCNIMLWQQALAAGRRTAARQMAKKGIATLRELEADFNACWPARNKGIALRHWPLFKWRIEDYRKAVLHFPPDVARIGKVSAVTG